VSAAGSVVAVAVTADAWHVFATGRGIDRPAAQIAALIDPAFLAESGWDPARVVLSPPPEHRLLGRPVCRVEGCVTTAPARCGICTSCRRRLAEHGLGEDQIASLPTAGQMRGPGSCVVPGCAREWVSSGSALCRTHLDLQQALGIGVEELCVHPQARPLPACGPCEVAACPRQRRHRDGSYCEAHQQRLRDATDRDPALDEGHWRLTEPAVGRGGQISLRGLPPLVVAQLLLGLQQRSRVDAVKTKEADLRAFCNQLRRQQVATIGDYVMAADPDGTFQALVNSLIIHARRALATPETEVTKDEWDLVVFGHSGTVSFTKITQGGCGRSPSGGQLMICPNAASVRDAAPARAWLCAITWAAWCGCRSRCGCAPTAARTSRCLAVATWKRS
jgi:hypothetical protein